MSAFDGRVHGCLDNSAYVKGVTDTISPMVRTQVELGSYITHVNDHFVVGNTFASVLQLLFARLCVPQALCHVCELLCQLGLLLLADADARLQQLCPVLCPCVPSRLMLLLLADFGVSLICLHPRILGGASPLSLLFCCCCIASLLLGDLVQPCHQLVQLLFDVLFLFFHFLLPSKSVC